MRTSRSSPPSTRRITRDTGTFTRTTPGSQSLERALGLLRAFLPNVSSLSNAEFAERTGLPRPTVSRLTRSLVNSGFLSHDAQTGSYRLSPVHLSLALSFRYASANLASAVPHMRRIARDEQVNVGLTTADGIWMVYLEAFREAKDLILRSSFPGTRVPMGSSSSGHAFLAGASAQARERCFEELAQHHGRHWPSIRAGISKSTRCIAKTGYCRSDAVVGLIAIASPIAGPDGTVYVLNLSFSSEVDNSDEAIARYVTLLRDLVSSVKTEWGRDSN